MAVQTEIKTWQPSLKFQCAFYAFMMLISIDRIYWAENAVRTHGWYMQLTVCMPWICGLWAGIALIMDSKRRIVNDQVAGSQLFLLAFVVSASCFAIEKLAALIR